MMRWKSPLLCGALVLSLVTMSPASANACPLLHCLFGWMCCCKKQPVCPPRCPRPHCDSCASGAAAYYRPAVSSYRPTTSYYAAPIVTEPTPTYQTTPITPSELPELGTYEPLPFPSAHLRERARTVQRRPADKRTASATANRRPTHRIVQRSKTPAPRRQLTGHHGDLRGQTQTRQATARARWVPVTQPVVRTATRRAR